MSGLLHDRIDSHVEVSRVEYAPPPDGEAGGKGEAEHEKY